MTHLDEKLTQIHGESGLHRPIVRGRLARMLFAALARIAFARRPRRR
ncbi:MAG TPA: hypothetical protein VM681_06225 [Candidatus Thermoplasmatota archaeon]|nr:hypothetical protein [Candidatus Thermoplasmatota archaeon]